MLRIECKATCAQYIQADAWAGFTVRRGTREAEIDGTLARLNPLISLSISTWDDVCKLWYAVG